MSSEPAVVLDTSAILAYLLGEPGCEQVRQLLRQASAGSLRALLSIMTRYELRYLNLRAGGEAQADQVEERLSDLPLRVEPVDEGQLKRAAALKANGGLSVADSWIAALAAERNATLVHRDPEFEAVAQMVKLQALPAR